MKLKKIILLSTFIVFILSACQDEKKNELEERQKIEQMETEREAEEAKEEQMKKKAHSIAAKIKENQSLDIFINALQKADLSQNLIENEGPFTVFSPTNSAFEKLNDDAFDKWMENGNDDLVDILNYHIVEDKITTEDLRNGIEDGGGEHTIITMQGEKLTVLMSGNNIVLKGESGTMSTITESDIEASNGIFHIIDTVVMVEDL